MIRHLLKLVWNRKRSNALVMAEIFFSFLVAFFVLTVAISLSLGWNRDPGFEWRNVWLINVDSGIPQGEMAMQDDPFREPLARALRDLRSMPAVVDAAASDTPPYTNATSSGRWEIDGRVINLIRDEVTDGFANTMQLKMLRGRWFGPEDDGAPYRAVVLDTDLAKAFFGDVDPIGKNFGDREGLPDRVVGVMAPYLKDGEFSLPKMNMMFIRKSLVKPNGRVPHRILVRVRPGTNAAFEEQLTRRLQQQLPDASVRVQRLEHLRASEIRQRLTPLMVAGIVAAFLIAMVALGLTGVLWQTVTRRTRELGVRRALGASGSDVRRQILIEVALIATLALAVGAVLVLQLPLLGVLAYVTVQAFTIGFIAAIVLIYAITLLCGAYPSWLASRVEPAEALRYE